MRAKSFAQVYLEQLERLEARIRCLSDLHRQWQLREKELPGDCPALCRRTQGELLEAVEQLRDRQRQVARVLERVENPTWYRLLHLRYVLYQPLGAIADSFGADYSWVTTTHGRAIRCLEEILRQEGFVTGCDREPLLVTAGVVSISGKEMR